MQEFTGVLVSRAELEELIARQVREAVEAALSAAGISGADSRVMTAQQLADELGVSAAHVYRLAAEGRIPVLGTKKSRRFLLRDVIAALRNHKFKNLEY